MYKNNTCKTIALLLFSLVTATFYSDAIAVEGLDDLGKIARQLKADFKKGPIGDSKGWDLKNNKKGVKVYTRKVDITPVKSFRGEVEIKCDFDALVGLLTYDDDYPNWMYLVEKSKIIKKLNETDMIVYTVNQPIWPCKTRDAVTFKWWSQDPETLVVRARFIGLPDFIPEKKGLIRVPLLMGQYVLTPKDNGDVHIVYEALTDPVVKFVPKWAIGWTVKWCAIITLSKIRDMANLKEYKEKCPAWIKVPSKK